MVNNTPIESPNDNKIKPPVIPARHVFCGLVWPEKGFPAFLCTIGERMQENDKTFDSINALEIYQEGEAKTFSALTEMFKDLPKYAKMIYVSREPRFESYVRDFIRWKRSLSSDLRLINTQLSTFEAGILKIKEYTKGERLVFPEKSLIKAQLALFSKESLKDETAFYAVRALTMVIGTFDRKKPAAGQETEPKLKAWW